MVAFSMTGHDEELRRLREVEQRLLRFRAELSRAAKITSKLSEENSGRIGCMMALVATGNLCRAISLDEREIKPLNLIFNAFEDAEAGVSSSLFSPNRRRGRPPISQTELRQRGLLGAAVEALLRGQVGLDEACRWVARRAGNLAAAKSVKNADLWNAVKKWREHADGLDPEAWDNIAYKMACEQMTAAERSGAFTAESILSQAAALEANPT